MADKTALLLGSSGLVGSELLTLCLESNYYKKVITPLRTPLPIHDDKRKEIIIDFEMPPWGNLFPVDHVYCCLGTTIKKAGSKSNFIKVDHDYPLAFAGAAKKWNTSVFSVITAAGVSADSKIFYNRVKGELESNLKSMSLNSTLIFQPSLLLGNRNEFRYREILLSGIAKVTSWMTPRSYRAIHARTVANAMIKETCAERQGFNRISNQKMHQKG